MRRLPVLRSECADIPRPCPHITCRYHLAVETRGVSGETCSLDVADRDGLTLEAVGEILGISREAVRLIEDKALAKFHRGMRRERDDLPDPNLASIARDARVANRSLPTKDQIHVPKRPPRADGLCSRCRQTAAAPGFRTCPGCLAESKARNSRVRAA